MKRMIKMASLALMAMTTLTGCAAAVGAAAGAGAMAYRDDQMVSTTLDADMGQVVSWAETTFRSMGLTITENDMDGDEHEIVGENGDLTVKAKMEMDGSRTDVTVVAARNYVDYDKDYAQRVLDRIRNRGR